MAVLNKYEQALLEHLQSLLTRARLDRFRQVLQQRTRKLTVALADVHQAHNISAVLRSCDACGVQDVHVIESYNPFETNREISLGTEQWLSVYRYEGGDATRTCLSDLRRRGYRIVATSPHADSCSLDELPIEQPLALLFGGEKEGLASQTIEQADTAAFLPMVGFVESFNVSVAAALFLFHLSRRVRQGPADWQLSDGEQQRLLYEWVRGSVSHLEAIESRFREEWNATRQLPEDDR